MNMMTFMSPWRRDKEGGVIQSCCDTQEDQQAGLWAETGHGTKGAETGKKNRHRVLI